MRRLTPQPFVDDPLLTKQNQELQITQSELAAALPAASFFPSRVKPFSGVINMTPGQSRLLPQQSFECRRGDTVLYQGLLQVSLQPNANVTLLWKEVTPFGDQLLEYPEFLCANSVNACVLTVPFTRYFRSNRDNPTCGYTIRCLTANINYAVLTEHYQVFR